MGVKIHISVRIRSQVQQALHHEVVINTSFTYTKSNGCVCMHACILHLAFDESNKILHDMGCST